MANGEKTVSAKITTEKAEAFKAKAKTFKRSVPGQMEWLIDEWMSRAVGNSGVENG